MDMVVLAHIKEQSRLSLGSYGRPRMTEELKEIGIDVGHRRVGRLMRENGIVVARTRSFKVTTDSDHAFPCSALRKFAMVPSSHCSRSCRSVAVPLPTFGLANRCSWQMSA
jgi:transposase InsO family protein